MQDGEADAAFIGREGVQAARAHHSRVREELPIRALALSRADPALPTEYRDGGVTRAGRGLRSNRGR